MEQDDDKILLKLHRDYTKDEAVNYLFSKLQEKEVELGMKKDKIDELQALNKQLKKNLCTISTKMSLIKRYFKVKFNREYGLRIIEKQKQLI